MTGGLVFQCIILRRPLSAHAYARLEPEEKEAVALANELRAATLEGRLRGVWCMVRNEMRRGGKIAQAWQAIARAMGLIPGAHDYIFTWPDGALWLELKVKGGKINDNQKAFKAWCDHEGVPHATAFSAAEALVILRQQGALA